MKALIIIWVFKCCRFTEEKENEKCGGIISLLLAWYENRGENGVGKIFCRICHAHDQYMFIVIFGMYSYILAFLLAAETV